MAQATERTPCRATKIAIPCRPVWFLAGLTPWDGAPLVQTSVQVGKYLEEDLLPGEKRKKDAFAVQSFAAKPLLGFFRCADSAHSDGWVA